MIDFTITRAETPESMSPFMVFPVSPEPFMRQAMRCGCDPYNSIDAAESALFDEIAAEEAAESALQDAWEHEVALRTSA